MTKRVTVVGSDTNRGNIRVREYLASPTDDKGTLLLTPIDQGLDESGNPGQRITHHVGESQVILVRDERAPRTG